MQQQEALELPEIVNLIRPLLTIDCLCSCVLVNKVWHEAFTPFLWSTFYFGHEKDTNPPLQPPSIAAIHRHAHLIKTLIIKSLKPPFQLTLFKNTPLTQLQALHFCKKPQYQDTCLRLGWIFLQNPGLRVVEYDGRYSDSLTNRGGDYGALLSCPALTELTVRGVSFEHDYCEPFQQLCAMRLQKYSFEGPRFATLTKWTNIPMPHLQELTLKTEGGSSDVSGELIILQCPNLKTLRWSIPEKLRMPRFTRILAACPRLEAIEVRRAVLIDLVISSILNSLQVLATEVIFPGDREAALKGDSYGFCGMAFDALRLHFSTLVVLDIGPESTQVDSISILKVLNSCPNLRELTAYRLEAKDICYGHPQHPEQQDSWACRGLEVFKVMIGDVSPNGRASLNMGEAVLPRFAALSRLRVLHVGGDMRFPPPPHHLTRGGLVLALHQGLGMLAGLERLESVSVGWFEQHVDREQVEWMKRHWTGLKVLEGVKLPCGEPIVSEAIQWALSKVDTKKWLEEREHYFKQ